MKPITRQQLIDLGLLKPPAYFQALPPGHPEREDYLMRLITGGIDTMPWNPPAPLSPKENN